jgi:hypothetical protein
LIRRSTQTSSRDKNSSFFYRFIIDELCVLSLKEDFKQKKRKRHHSDR